MPEHPTHPHYDDDLIVNPETSHETSDVNVRAIVWFIVIFVAFAAVMHVMLWFLFKFFVKLERRSAENAPLSGISRPADANVPVLPRLQPFPSKNTGQTVVPPYTNTPVADMEEMRAHEEQVLGNYGWVDRQHGIARMPIEAAKQLALRSNIYQVNSGATPPPAPSAPAKPNSKPTVSAGGDSAANARAAQAGTTTGRIP